MRVLLSLLLFLLSACSAPARGPDPNLHRSGGSTVSLLVFGDQRPSCSTGIYAPAVGLVQRQVVAEAPAADLIIATGDYLCAWPHEQAKALTQLQTWMEPFPSEIWRKSVIALGNHEVGHHQILRSAQISTLPQGFIEIMGVRVVWLPSDADLAHVLLRDWLDQALDFPGRLVVVRHEPWGALGTRGDGWIRDRVRAASPTLILHGHVHTWALPGQTVDGQVLGRREVVVGNGGAPSAPWYGVTRVTLAPDGSVTVVGVDTTGLERNRVWIP